MRRLILPAFGLLALGMAAQAAVTSRNDRPEDQAAWFLVHAEDGIKLTYGLPDSDLIGLMLTCNPGDTTITVYGELEPDLASLKPANNGPISIDPLSQGEAWEMTLSVTDPGFNTLINQGYLPVRMDDRTGRIEATAAERRLASHFFNACTRQHA